MLGSALIVAHSLRADRVELRGAIEDLRDAIAEPGADEGAAGRVGRGAGRPSRRHRRPVGPGARRVVRHDPAAIPNPDAASECVLRG